MVGGGDDVGAEVMDRVEVRVSQHPQKSPGVSQWVVDAGAEPEVGEVALAVVVVVGSRQPNQPGS